jgi:5-(carboxyamino)imidazole ribonucleotide synthase
MEHAPVRPGPELLRIVQHRGRQKQWLHDNGFPVGSYAHVTTADELATAAREIGPALFVKACEGGYDGRSQIRFDGDDASSAWASLGGRPAVAEQALDLELELSVLVARRASGDVVVYPPAENYHERQILAWSVLPGELDPRVARDARSLASGIAEAFGLEGILAVEMFLLRDGRLLVNELAPRPHNSGHLTFDAAITSQFEQQVRAICGLPLGSTELLRPAAMSMPDVKLHLYGKGAARVGRKMGHITALGDTVDEAAAKALAARDVLC